MFGLQLNVAATTIKNRFVQKSQNKTMEFSNMKCVSSDAF